MTRKATDHRDSGGDVAGRDSAGPADKKKIQLPRNAHEEAPPEMASESFKFVELKFGCFRLS